MLNHGRAEQASEHHDGNHCRSDVDHSPRTPSVSPQSPAATQQSLAASGIRRTSSNRWRLRPAGRRWSTVVCGYSDLLGRSGL
jgi:hypothetical protein